MDLKDFLTNEKVANKFKKSQFDLVNYAICLAENMIKTGRDSRVRTDSQNRAMQILSEILNDKDQLDEIVEQPELEEGERYSSYKESASLSEKGAERKKNRKILAD